MDGQSAVVLELLPATDAPRPLLFGVTGSGLVGNNGMAQTAQTVRLDFSAPSGNLLPPPPQTSADLPRPKVIIQAVQSTEEGK